MADGKRGRRPDSDELKAAKKKLKDAKTEDAKVAAKAEVDRIQAKEKAAKQSGPRPADGRTTEHDRVHVEDLTEDQLFALTMQHARKIEIEEGLVAKAKTSLKAARNLARSELGKNALHDIKLYQELETEEGQEKLRETVRRQERIARWAGMETGHMDDLFPEDRTPIEDKTFDDGKRAGLKGEAGSPPSHLTGSLQQAWLRGYHEGQAVLSAGFKAKPEPFGAEPPKEPKGDDAPADFKTYWFGMGYEARKAGYGGSIPDDVPNEFRDDWHNGWVKRADEVDQANRERVAA